MPVPINYLAVFGAAAASMVLGAIWYGPLFSTRWVELSGMTPETIAAAKAKGMGKSYALAAIGSLVMAYVLAHSFVFASSYLMLASSAIGPGPNAAIAAGLMVGFWNWLGFIAPVTLGAVLWEGKPWKLWLLNNAYYLLSLLVMGMILALWP